MMVMSAASADEEGVNFGENSDLQPTQSGSARMLRCRYEVACFCYATLLILPYQILL